MNEFPQLVRLRTKSWYPQSVAVIVDDVDWGEVTKRWGTVTLFVDGVAKGTYSRWRGITIDQHRFRVRWKWFSGPRVGDGLDSWDVTPAALFQIPATYYVRNRHGHVGDITVKLNWGGGVHVDISPLREPDVVRLVLVAVVLEGTISDEWGQARSG